MKRKLQTSSKMETGEQLHKYQTQDEDVYSLGGRETEQPDTLLCLPAELSFALSIKNSSKPDEEETNELVTRNGTAFVECLKDFTSV